MSKLPKPTIRRLGGPGERRVSRYPWDKPSEIIMIRPDVQLISVVKLLA